MVFLKLTIEIFQKNVYNVTLHEKVKIKIYTIF